MAKRRGTTTEDLYRFQFVADARISPDGGSVLFVLSRCHRDRKRDTYESHIWRVKAGGGPAARFTNSNESESSPQWSPDGKRVLFLSARDAEDEQKGKTQLWVIPADGGEAVRITNRKHGVSSPSWSPDGKSVLFAARVPLDPEKDALPEDRQSDVIHINRISYRMNGAGYHHAFRTHLFVISSRGGRPRQITKGDWSPESAAWSIDGSRIYCTGNREEDADHTYARSLYSISAATGRVKRLCGLKGAMSSPAPSPDGNRIAFVGSTLKRSLGTNSHVYVIPASGGPPRNVSGHLDVSVGTSVNSDARTASPGLGLVWSPDGKQIKLLASVRGADRLFGLDVASGAMTCYTEGERTIESVSYSTDHTASAYTQMTPTRLAEVWLWRAGRKEKRLTRFNDALLRGLALVEPDRFEFRASDGAQVEGWTMLPGGPARGKRPGILQIHGGPRTAYGLGFMHEFQVLCAAGFAVCYINPRGSSSYGEDWACAVGRHYGERDYEDVMEAVDVVLRRYPISSRNLGVTGGSYGGFMTNWIVGHTNRFKAACTQRSICNWVSFFGTSDIGWRFAPEEVGGLPWRNLDTYWKKSPLAYVEKVETPLLIIHSDEDWRCPVEQAEQLFVGLKTLGKEAEFIRFPGESHELSRSGKPSHRAERLDAIVGWFSDKLQPGSTRSRPGPRRRGQ
jgi:dipeptidyl aminopeptidase/acylaminoacyl peptidase